jgi:hypothetical protein
MPAKLSDDDLLAAVCQCGMKADRDAVGRRLAALLGIEIDPAAVEARLARLRLAGFLRVSRCGPPGTSCFHLTQMGVERLESLDCEPATPATE